ncbi:hypothetical protein [Nocardioides jensenii]|uniref:hypothetical protein n=1 Tax=Nocardioides jensenii TaxID=1843 RepID=UPI00082FFC6B|nr:hypothetical protein [Nocardioides jensenii]
MTAEDTTLHATDAVFAAEQAMGRALRVVDDLHTTINSALRVLDDAELDSAKARLTDRGDFYLDTAAEHIARLQTRVGDLPHQSDELYGYLTLASASLTEAHNLLNETDASDPELARDVAQLKTRIAVVSEMVSLAQPLARLATRHVDGARHACQQVTPATLLDSVTLERSIVTAGKELGRADEDVRLLEEVVDHSAANARQATGIACEISDNARRRMAEHGRAPAPTAAAPAAGAPTR